jgi:hypothetical protein
MTSRSKNPRRRPPEPPASRARNIQISASELDSPAGYSALEVRRATLREVIDPKTPTKNSAELSAREFKDLAIARLSLLPEDFQMAVMGYGLINRHRAIAEVQAGTPLGRHIAMLQHESVALLIRAATPTKG